MVAGVGLGLLLLVGGVCSTHFGCVDIVVTIDGEDVAVPHLHVRFLHRIATFSGILCFGLPAKERESLGPHVQGRVRGSRRM